MYLQEKEMTKLSFPKMANALLMLIIMTLIVGVEFASAQSRSRIEGTVKDAKTGEPLPGANVLVVGTSLGAVTNLNGHFVIVNVPVGSYDVRASMVGYNSELVKSVLVSVERVATVNFTLEPAAIETKEVVVVANRAQLHKEVSSTQLVATGSQIRSTAGIREINAFLTRLPGVETTDNGFLTIRGGSADQVGTLVNGLAYNNAAVGNAETSIPLSAIEQVSVLAGGYNAEYGNFRSGLIDITTKTGTQNAYHGTIDISADQSHMRRFGNSLYDPLNDILAPYLDPSIAFQGTVAGYANNPYELQQHASFQGWDYWAAINNKGRPLPMQVSPLELYLFTSWMTMSIPDYNGLQQQMAVNPSILGNMTKAQADSMLSATRNAFAQHANKEGGNDYNLDGGFGGPVPLIGKALGNATFYLSNNTRNSNFIEPVVLSSDFRSTSLLTVKSTPTHDITLTLNGLWKREIGVSPIRPASGDEPNISGRGGFMDANNLNWIYNNTGISGDNYDYLYDPAYFPILDQTTLMTGLTFNQLLSPKTYYQITLSRLSIADHSPTGDNRDTTMITQFGPIHVDESPYGKWQFAPNHDVQGYIFPSYDAPPGITQMRFRGKEGNLHDQSVTNQWEAKIDLASQIGDHNFVKAGVEYNLFDLDHNFWEEWNNNAYNTYEFNYHRKPSQTGVYAQDQISYQGIVANLGVRADYYYGGGGLWPSEPFVSVFQPQAVDTSLYSYLNSGRSYIFSLWDQYNQTHPGFLQPVKNFLTVSPRLGVSFPITDRSKFYFNYGWFRSNPPYYSMYEFTYRYTKNGLYQMSNPNLEPPLTISYELGVVYNFYSSYILRVSGYDKDITGQQGRVNYQTLASTLGLNYRSYLNNEYQSIQGVEVELSKNDNSWITGWLNFDYQLSKTGNTGVQYVYDIPITDQSNLYQGNESPTLPRPDLNAEVTFKSPAHWGPQPAGLDLLGNWSLTFFGEWRAGDYFTWNPLDQNHVSDNQQWPSYYRVDMKLTRDFKLAGLDAALYLNVTNVFNFKINEMGNLYAFSSQLASSDNYQINNSDESNYLASLHLPMYKSSAFDALRQTHPGLFIGGNDQVGDLRSASKPYINNPDYTDLFLYGQPRDIWFGIKIDF